MVFGERWCDSEVEREKNMGRRSCATDKLGPLETVPRDLPS